jgi:hypothetical protein
MINTIAKIILGICVIVAVIGILAAAILILVG